MESRVTEKQREINAIKMSLTTEMCPHCVKETTIKWDVKKEGYRMFCPNCGKLFMLCGECLEDGFCDFNSEEDICYRFVEEMWKEFEDITLNSDEDGREYFDDEFYLCGHKFPAGIEKSDVWRWFNKVHPKGISYLINEFE